MAGRYAEGNETPFPDVVLRLRHHPSFNGGCCVCAFMRGDVDDKIFGGDFPPVSKRGQRGRLRRRVP